MNKVCVYCGSSPGSEPEYLQAASVLGEELVNRNISLVYGGARVGLMGEIADTVLAGGGEVIGVIPKALEEKEVAHYGLTELIVVGSMNERKAEMAELSDGFIAMPGGLGTLEELFEVLTWAQLGFHRSACGLLNINGYFDKLVSFLDHSVEQGFVKPVHRELLLVESEVLNLLTAMHDYVSPVVDKWIGQNET